MKKKNLTTIFLLLILMLVFTVSACGNKKKTKESDKASTDEGKETTNNNDDDSDEEIITFESIAAQDHIHSYEIEVVKVTCTTDGYTNHTCSCGDSYQTDTIKATGHSYGGWNTTKAATEKAKGEAERVCSICGEKDTKKLDKLEKGHVHSYTQKIVKPTCTMEGYTTNTCSCGDSYTSDPTAKTVHSYTSKVTAATCTTEGYTTYTCACGDSYVGDKTAKKNHTYTDKVVAETCTSDGYTKHTCSCGSSYIDTKVAATGHSYSVTSNTATCLKDGVKTETCGKCGNQKTTTVKATGQHTTKTETKDATCTKDGYTKVSCEACGTVISNTVIQAGHVEKTETKEASCVWPGYKKVTCEKCGTVISNTTIPATGKHNWTTKTLTEAALEAYDAGYSDWMKYLSFSEHNVQICSDCKQIDISTATSKLTDVEAANIMLGYVNDLRREVLGEGYDLVLDTTLLELAKIRAKEISVNYSHFGGTYTNAGENIIDSASNVSSAFNGWKKSQGHYENMIEKDYKYFAYAFYHGDLKDSTVVYGVQLFWTQSSKKGYLATNGN